MSDGQAQIAQLWVFPVKSCAGVRVAQARLRVTGLEWDRHWMVVDDEGLFLSQREAPRMVLIRPAVLPDVDGGVLQLSAPGMPELRVPLHPALQPPVRVQVWDDSVSALAVSAAADAWLGEFLGIGGLRLVRFDDRQQRRCSTRWSQGVAASTHFADGYPLLVCTDTAVLELNQRLAAQGHRPVGMERFRANLVLSGLPAHDEDAIGRLLTGPEEASRPQDVACLQLVKPCARCPIPDIDPATAVSGHGVGDALQAYRQDHRVGGAITFGMNAIVAGGAGAYLREGQTLEVQYRFD